MFSRYDCMSESNVGDTVDNNNYPDPLSINFNRMELQTLPKLREVNQADLTRFWFFILKTYTNIAEGDDIILTLNNVPYIGTLKPGDSLYIPESDDLYKAVNLKSQSV
jgi:hypothetical protein